MSTLKLTIAVTIVSSQFNQRCCCWNIKGGVCARSYKVVKALIAYFLSCALCRSNIRAPSYLEPPLSVAFTHHIAASLPSSCPRLPVSLLFCGTSLPDSCCIWVSKPRQAVCTSASRTGRTFSLGSWQQLAFYFGLLVSVSCASPLEVCCCNWLMFLLPEGSKVTGIKQAQ